MNLENIPFIEFEHLLAEIGVGWVGWYRNLANCGVGGRFFAFAICWNWSSALFGVYFYPGESSNISEVWLKWVCIGNYLTDAARASLIQCSHSTSRRVHWRSKAIWWKAKSHSETLRVCFRDAYWWSDKPSLNAVLFLVFSYVCQQVCYSVGILSSAPKKRSQNIRKTGLVCAFTDEYYLLLLNVAKIATEAALQGA